MAPSADTEINSEDERSADWIVPLSADTQQLDDIDTITTLSLQTQTLESADRWNAKSSDINRSANTMTDLSLQMNGTVCTHRD